VYLCVLCGSQNKQRLFPYAALTDWFFMTQTDSVYCAVRTGSSTITQVNLWLRHLVADLSPRRTGFNPRSVHVIFMVDKVAMGHVFLRVLWFCLVSIITPMLHVHLHLLPEGQMGKFWEPSRKKCPIGNRGALDTKSRALCSSLKG
jgi:hypothetical protein